jgi:ABC-2 type transport system permease protein
MRWLWRPYAMFRAQLLVALSYPIDVTLSLANGVFIIAAFYFLSEYLVPGRHDAGGARAYFSFVALGIVFSSLLNSWFSSFSGELRELQTTGALEMLLATGATPTLVVAGMTLGGLAMAALESGSALLAARLVFRLQTGVAQWGVLLAAVMLGLGIYCCLGLLSAGFVLLFKRGNPVAFLFDKASVLLGGVYFPVAVLPLPLRQLAELLPLTHLLRLLRAAVGANREGVGVGTEALLLLGMLIVLLVAAVVAFRECLKVVLRHGTVAHY